MRGILGTLAFGLASSLLIAVLAGYAGRWSPAFEIVSAFRLHLALVAAGVGIVLGVVKLWRSAGLAFLAALVAAAGLGPVLTPLQPFGAHAAIGGRPLTVLYANLRDDNPHPEALGAALRAADADILITSETMLAVAGSAGRLREHYPFQQVNPATQWNVRTAIWSKYPLLGGKLYLNNTVAPTAASAVADLGDGVLLGLIGAHFSRPYEGLREAQAGALGPIAEELGNTQFGRSELARPLVVAGDFNAPPWSWVAKRAAEVTNTRIIGGHRITWRGKYPSPFGMLPAHWGQQIDHILVSDEISVETIETLELPGSDHLGVLAHLRIRAP